MLAFISSPDFCFCCVTGAAARPQGGALRARQIMRSTPKQGTYEGSSSPMGEDKQAKNMEAGYAYKKSCVSSLWLILSSNCDRRSSNHWAYASSMASSILAQLLRKSAAAKFSML